MNPETIPDASLSYADWATRALEHCRFLSEEIGPRPSTGAGEKEAADYALQVLAQAGAQPRRELILSQRLTYRPFSLAIGAALLGQVLAGRSSKRRVAGALLSAAGAWAFAKEADLKANWTHKLLATGDSQNVVGTIAARGQSQKRIVLCAHLDSHRTPIFYSHPLWLKVFSPVIALTFASMIVDTLRHLLGRSRSSKIGKMSIGLQLASLALTLQGDSSPHNKGANDNASGAATVLALAEKLAAEPLENCEVWIVLLGCEEVGAHGMRALMRRHKIALRDASILNFDMVGIGTPAILESEGLIRKIECDAHLRSIAFQAAQDEPDLIAGGHAGAAYTDGAVALQNGIATLTIDSLTPPEHPAHARGNYWHQLSDTFDKIEPECLGKAVKLGWKMLQKMDQAS